MTQLVDITLPTGEHATVPQQDVPQALAAGATLRGGAPSAQTASSSEDSGGLLGQVAAGVLGAGSTATLGLTDKLAREVPYVLGGAEVSRDFTNELRTVRERNPGSTIAGEVGGLLLNPEAFSAAGEAAAAPVASALGEGLLAKAATSAARVGAETALGGAQHAITEESLGDHDLNAQAIWSQAAKEGLLGAAGGGVLGLGGGLVGKTTGLLARRSGPMSAELLDQIAGGVEGAGVGVRDQVARSERTIEGLRATGATTDQAVDMVQGLDMAAKAQASTEPIGKDIIDSAAEEYISRVAGKNPERAELLRQHYKNVLKPFEQGVSDTDRAALDMVKSGNGVMRNGEDIANEAQFAMKPSRFSKLVDPNRIDAQMDQVAGLMQDVDHALSFWESTASKGGGEGAIRTLRKQWTDMSDLLHEYSINPSPALSRDLNIGMNRLKQNLDRFVPYGRSPGAVIEGKAIRFGVPEFVSNPEYGIEQLANKVRSGLEDEAVWGDAGAAQARENLSFSDNFERHKDFVDTFGVTKDQSLGVRIPEIDYSKTRSVLDKITGNPEIDESLQPIKSARAAIARQRSRFAALRESGELTEAQVTKFAQAEKDLNAFEASLNGAMKRAAIENRLKAAVLEEGHSGVGGLLGAGTDMVNRPFKTLERMAQIKHTKDRVLGGVKLALQDVAGVGGSSTEGVTARSVAPRPKEKVISEMETIRSIANDPAKLEMAASRMVGDLSKYAPQTADALRLTAMRALLYLAREAPPASVSTLGTLGTPKGRYSDVQIHDWETKRNAAMNPADVIQDMKHGRLNRDAIMTAKAVAPQMFAEMQNLAREQIDRMAARGELDRMPYQQKAVIASLLEVHADRTFEPDFMAMMQAAKAMPAPTPTGPAPAGGGNSGAPTKPPSWMVTESQRIEGGI